MTAVMGLPHLPHSQWARSTLAGAFRKAAAEERLPPSTDCPSELSGYAETRLILRPTKLLQAYGVVPDLGHMSNPITLEIHHVDVVCRDRFTGRFTGSARSGLSAVKHRECRNAVGLLILCETLQFIVAIRDGRQQVLHPLSVSFKGTYLGQRTGLGRKRRSRKTIHLASAPPLPRLTGFEKCSSLTQYVTHHFAYLYD